MLVLSTIHDPMPDGKPFAEREGLVFIGSFQHPPNVDGVLWYAREVLPRLRERLPGVPTYIVGSNVPSAIRALAADDFVVTGFVKDVDPYFTGCRVSMSPLRYGAGVKGKVNLAMSYGLPVVATSPSIEGMYLVPGQDVLVADDADAFAEAIAQVYRDEIAVGAAARGRPRQHPGAFLARRRAQRDHAPDRPRARQAAGGARRGVADVARRRAVSAAMRSRRPRRQRRTNTRSNTA